MIFLRRPSWYLPEQAAASEPLAAGRRAVLGRIVSLGTGLQTESLIT